MLTLYSKRKSSNNKQYESEGLDEGLDVNYFTWKCCRGNGGLTKQLHCLFAAVGTESKVCYLFACYYFYIPQPLTELHMEVKCNLLWNTVLHWCECSRREWILLVEYSQIW